MHCEYYYRWYSIVQCSPNHTHIHLHRLLGTIILYHCGWWILLLLLLWFLMWVCHCYYRGGKFEYGSFCVHVFSYFAIYGWAFTLTQLCALPLTHSFTHPPTHSLIHSLTRTHSLAQCIFQHLCLCGSFVSNMDSLTQLSSFSLQPGTPVVNIELLQN